MRQLLLAQGKKFHQQALFRDCLVLTLFGMALRGALLLLFPEPYGEDGFGRIYFQDSLFLSHWLPLTQFLVHGISRLTSDIFLLRLVFALIGSLASVSFYLFLRRITDRGLALLGGFLFGANPLYILLSLMPYQDVLFLGLFFAFLACFPALEGPPGNGEAVPGTSFIFPSLSRRKTHPPSIRYFQNAGLGSVFLGLASLTRYESWFVIPLLVFWSLKATAPSGRFLSRLGSAFQAGLYFAWAPFLWLFLNRMLFGSWTHFLFQTQDQTFYAWNPHFDVVWMLAYAGRMFWWILIFGTPLVLLAVAGIGEVLSRGSSLDPALKTLLALGLFALLFFFILLGKGQDTVYRFSMIPLSVTLVLTMVGLQALRTSLQELPSTDLVRAAQRKFGPAVAIGLVCAVALYSGIRLARVTSRPEFKDPYLIAQFLQINLSSTGRALVVAQGQGPSEAAPLAYQRIVAQSGQLRNRILSSGLLSLTDASELLDYAQQEEIEIVIWFPDFQPVLPSDRFFADLMDSSASWLQPVLETETARVSRVAGWPQRLWSK